MASLNPDARGVVQGARSALRATVADRGRIEAALRMRLGSSALPSNTVAPARAAGIAWRLAPGAAFGVCVLGGVLFFGLHARPNATALSSGGEVQAKVAAEGTASVPNQPSSTEPAATTQSPVVAAPAVPPISSTLRRQDRLTQEVALLTRATSALGAGRPGDALKALNEHQREFPNGILSEERRAAKALALCALGQVTAGRAELARLSPGSPEAGQARHVCDAASALDEQDVR